MTSPVSMPAGHEIVAEDLDAYENATGVWQTWTPTLANITQGSGGVVVARYRQVGKTVDFHFRFTMGTGSAIGTNPGFSLPATPHSSYAAFRDDMATNVVLVDAGTNSQPGALLLPVVSAPTVWFQSLTAGVFTGLTATTPFTWSAANGDELLATGTYEAA